MNNIYVWYNTLITITTPENIRVRRPGYFDSTKLIANHIINIFATSFIVKLGFNYIAVSPNQSVYSLTSSIDSNLTRIGWIE